MTHTARIYHRTAPGEQALERTDPRLTDAHRRLLGLVQEATPFDTISARLGQWSDVQILRCLDELETLDCIESIPVEWLEELYRLGCYEPEPRA